MFWSYPIEFGCCTILRIQDGVSQVDMSIEETRVETRTASRWRSWSFRRRTSDGGLGSHKLSWRLCIERLCSPSVTRSRCRYDIDTHTCFSRLFSP